MLHTKTRRVADVIVVECEGAIVYGDDATLLRQVVKDLLHDQPQVVLGLSEVNFIDSNGLGTLVGLHSSAESAGGHLKLAGLGPRVKDAMLVARLNTIFRIYGTVEEAVESFRLETTPAAIGELQH